MILFTLNQCQWDVHSCNAVGDRTVQIFFCIKRLLIQILCNKSLDNVNEDKDFFICHPHNGQFLLFTLCLLQSQKYL